MQHQKLNPKIQKEHMAYLKEKEKKMKVKAEKWNGLSRRLVLNAALTNGQLPPAEQIPESYQLIINSETAAMAGATQPNGGLGPQGSWFCTRNRRQPVQREHLLEHEGQTNQPVIFHPL